MEPATLGFNSFFVPVLFDSSAHFSFFVPFLFLSILLSFLFFFCFVSALLLSHRSPQSSHKSCFVRRLSTCSVALCVRTKTLHASNSLTARRRCSRMTRYSTWRCRRRRFLVRACVKANVLCVISLICSVRIVSAFPICSLIILRLSTYCVCFHFICFHYALLPLHLSLSRANQRLPPSVFVLLSFRIHLLSLSACADQRTSASPTVIPLHEACRHYASAIRALQRQQQQEGTPLTLAERTCVCVSCLFASLYFVCTSICLCFCECFGCSLR